MTFHPATRSSRRGLWLAWLVIVVVVGGLAVWAALVAKPNPGPARLAAELQLRSATGMREIGMPGALGQVEKSLARGTTFERAAAVVAAAEQRGAVGGRQRIADLQRGFAIADLQRGVAIADLQRGLADPGRASEDTAADLLAAQVLARLYVDDDVAARADGLADSSRARLVESFGWIGELALHPEGTADAAARATLLDDAKRTAIANLAMVILGGFGVLLGVIVIIIALVRVRVGSIAAAYRAEDGPAGAFVETFVIWLVVFFASATGIRFAAGDDAGPGMLAAVGTSQACSLAALCWLMSRGIAWPAVRQRIGLHSGRGLLREAGAGVVAYVGMLPLILIGVIGSWFVQKLGAPQASHPATELLSGSAAMIAAVVVLGAVLAPIVEELLFRGVLYHHLRSATRKRGPILSVLLSACISGVIFAAIHPQGLAGIPFLTAIGVGLAITREWRGSIVAPMVAHACVNTVTFTFSIFAL